MSEEASKSENNDRKDGTLQTNGLGVSSGLSGPRTDGKKLQTLLNKLNAQPTQAIEEDNMFKADRNVIHFAAADELEPYRQELYSCVTPHDINAEVDVNSEYEQVIANDSENKVDQVEVDLQGAGRPLLAGAVNPAASQAQLVIVQGLAAQGIPQEQWPAIIAAINSGIGGADAAPASFPPQPPFPQFGQASIPTPALHNGSPSISSQVKGPAQRGSQTSPGYASSAQYAQYSSQNLAEQCRASPTGSSWLTTVKQEDSRDRNGKAGLAYIRRKEGKRSIKRIPRQPYSQHSLSHRFKSRLAIDRWILPARCSAKYALFRSSRYPLRSASSGKSPIRFNRPILGGPTEMAMARADTIKCRRGEAAPLVSPQAFRNMEQWILKATADEEDPQLSQVMAQTYREATEEQETFKLTSQNILASDAGCLPTPLNSSASQSSIIREDLEALGGFLSARAPLVPATDLKISLPTKSTTPSEKSAQKKSIENRQASGSGKKEAEEGEKIAEYKKRRAAAARRKVPNYQRELRAKYWQTVEIKKDLKQ